MTPSLSEGGAQRTRVAIFIHSCILLIRNLAPRPEVYSVYTQSYTEQAVARAHVTTEDETANATFDSHDARYEAARMHIDFLNSVSDAVQLACVRAKL